MKKLISTALMCFAASFFLLAGRPVSAIASSTYDRRNFAPVDSPGNSNSDKPATIFGMTFGGSGIGNGIAHITFFARDAFPTHREQNITIDASLAIIPLLWASLFQVILPMPMPALGAAAAVAFRRNRLPSGIKISFLTPTLFSSAAREKEFILGIHLVKATF
ncbi:MAG: hypothetical protein JXX29_19725 [Deltaproteobacteria bacterium]|nr:hypothetical protein [Deltaproteobacteria bacterium]MBN2673920.1 hypothetical protein [Deltaproteobacteria bacterium]